MTKVRHPGLRVDDRVTLAPHVHPIPAYAGKPFVGRDMILRVSSVIGKGTPRDPWTVKFTDDAGHFWHMQPGDLVRVDEGSTRVATKPAAQLEREIRDFLGARTPRGRSGTPR